VWRQALWRSLLCRSSGRIRVEIEHKGEALKNLKAGIKRVVAAFRMRLAHSHEQEMIDESLEESFRASDPPAHHGSDEPPSNAAAMWKTRGRAKGR
jgi:hypothetical protein